jgi:hypothetical protein
MLEGILACKLVGMQVGMLEGMQACKLVGKLEGMQVGMQACKLVVGIQARMAVGRQVCTLVGKLAVRIQACMVARSRLSYSSFFRRSNPSTGAPSCIEEATWHLFPVVFSFKGSFFG